MAFLGSLVAFLSSATAKSIGKFLYDRIEAFVSAKSSSLNAQDKAKLKTQSDELKTINNNIEANKNQTATEKELSDLREKIEELEQFQKKRKLPEALISPELFENWIEKEPIEDKALVAHKRLDALIDWCIKNKIRESKRWEIEEVSNNLAMFTSNLREARKNLHDNPTYSLYQQQVMEAEMTIRANLGTAKALFAEYSNCGG
jgi:hypothetical protein